MKRVLLLLVGLLCGCARVEAAWAHIQTAGSVTSSAGYGSNLTASTTLIATVFWDRIGTFSSISDTKTNTWVQINAELDDVASTKSRQYFVAVNNGAGADTVSVSITGSPTFVEVYISEYSGLNSTNPDATNKGAQSSGYSLSATASAANELLYAAELSNGANAIPPGMTSRTAPDGTVADGNSVNGSNTVTWSGVSGTAGLWLTIFKLPGGGATCPKTLSLLGVGC